MVVVRTLFYAVVYCGGSIKRRDTSCLNKLVRKTGSIVGMELDSLISVGAKGAEQTPSNHGEFSAFIEQYHLQTEEQLEPATVLFY